MKKLLRDVMSNEEKRQYRLAQKSRTVKEFEEEFERKLQDEKKVQDDENKN